MATIHKDSFRALAYEVLNQLTGSAPIDDNSITIYQIENELRDQYGFLLDKDDEKRLRLGQKPDQSRLITQKIALTDAGCQDCNEWVRSAMIDQFLTWNGQPYITEVSTCGTRISPVNNKGQLAIRAKQNNMPTYVVQGTQLLVCLTPDSVGVDEIEIIGIPQDPFNGMSGDDPGLWQRPWLVARSFKAQIKERAEMRFRGGSLTTRPLQDKVNNNAENPIK